jgi:hypothetical protein
MRKLMILGFVATVALLGCQTMDTGMSEEGMDEDMESGQMEEGMDEGMDEGMEKDESMESDSM